MKTQTLKIKGYEVEFSATIGDVDYSARTVVRAETKRKAVAKAKKRCKRELVNKANWDNEKLEYLELADCNLDEHATDYGRVTLSRS